MVTGGDSGGVEGVVVYVNDRRNDNSRDLAATTSARVVRRDDDTNAAPHVRGLENQAGQPGAPPVPPNPGSLRGRRRAAARCRTEPRRRVPLRRGVDRLTRRGRHIRPPARGMRDATGSKRWRHTGRAVESRSRATDDRNCDPQQESRSRARRSGLVGRQPVASTRPLRGPVTFAGLPAVTAGGLVAVMCVYASGATALATEEIKLRAGRGPGLRHRGTADTG